MGGHDGDSKEERERSKKQGVKKVESDWKGPLGRWGRLASKFVLDLNYSHVTKLFNKDWNYILKDDDLKDPCVETLNPAEKEIAHILGPQTFVFRPRKYPYLRWKVTENPKGMDIRMCKYDAFERWNSARGVRGATITVGKNQGLVECVEWTHDNSTQHMFYQHGDPWKHEVSACIASKEHAQQIHIWA